MDLLNYHEEIRALAQAAGAIIALVTLPIGVALSWKRTAQIKRTNDLTEATNAADKERNRARDDRELYVAAMENLSQDKVYTRQGALVVLSEIEATSDFYRPSFEVICSFISDRSASISKEEDLFFVDDDWFPPDLAVAIRAIRTKLTDTSKDHRNPLRVNLSDAVVPRIDLSECTINRGVFTKTDLSTANLHHTVFSDCSFYKTDFRSANLTSAHFIDLRLNRAQLEGANLTDAVFETVRFKKCRLTNANISNCDLRKSEISYLLPNESMRQQLGEWVIPESSWREDGFYHPISSATWEVDRPPLVRDEWTDLVAEKTELMTKLQRQE